MTNSFNLKSLSLVAMATASLVMGTLHPANAAAEEEDGRVRAALTKAGVEFQVTNDKTFKVIIKLKGGRTQVVLIDSNTSTIKGTNMEFREVYALAHKVEGPLPGNLTNKMMKQSHDKKIGAWEIIEGNGSSLAVFTAKIDAGLNDTNLVKIINSIGLVADTMEEEISSQDEY